MTAPRIVNVTAGHIQTEQQWTIEFTAPRHPGFQIAPSAFWAYGGVDMTVVTRDPRLAPGEVLIRARGSGSQLRRLLEWCDQLLSGWGLEVSGGFSSAPFMRPQPPAAPEREVG
jgi:hypothetical protein